MRNLNALPLSALRVIEAAGRLGTLTAAATELGVTPGALSQRLRKAEEALGRPLFARHPEGLAPTEALAEVLPRLTHHMAGLDDAAGALAGRAGNILTLSVAPLFASRWLIWRLHRFTEAHPEIALRLDPVSRTVDLDAAGVDAGIRVGPGPGTGVEAVKLLDQQVFPVCARAIAERLTTPRDLFRHPVIRETDALAGWAEWLATEGLTPEGLQPGPTYRDGAMCLDAAMMGQGLFMAWETLAADAVARGTLVAPFARRVPTGVAYWFVTTRLGARKSAVRRFRAWLTAEIDASRAEWASG
jgi:DNA-binding transcriptional LysR family regulator